MTTISRQQEDDDYEEGKVFGHESLLEQNDNEFLQIKTNFVGLKWRRR